MSGVVERIFRKHLNEMVSESAIVCAFCADCRERSGVLGEETLEEARAAIDAMIQDLMDARQWIGGALTRENN